MKFIIGVLVLFIVFTVVDYLTEGPGIDNDVFVKATTVCSYHGGLKRVYFKNQLGSKAEHLMVMCNNSTIVYRSIK